jgi:hypothetical protein
MLSQEKKQEIIQKLNERIQVLTCPMCHQHSFVIADGYFSHFLQDDMKDVSIGGSSIPTIAIVCTHCGFVSQHALGVLGMLPKNEEKKDGNK